MKKSRVIDFDTIRNSRYAGIKADASNSIDVTTEVIMETSRSKKEAFEALFDDLPELQKSAGIPEIVFRKSDDFTKAVLAGLHPEIPFQFDPYAVLEGEGSDGKDYFLMVSMFPADADGAVFRAFFYRVNADDENDPGEIREGDEWVAI